MTPDEITAELAKCEAVDPWDIGAWPDSAREHYAAALRELQSLQQRLAEAERERGEAITFVSYLQVYLGGNDDDATSDWELLDERWKDYARGILVRANRAASLEQRLAEQAGWLPIESAPKDGLFLVATDDARVDVVKPHFCNGWVYSATDRSELIMGPIRPNSTPSQSGPMPYKITHWRPLPAPPEAKGG